MDMQFWLIKSEPDTFSWDDLLQKQIEMWDGVRNYQARNNLRAMKTGDLALFYHSNIGKEIVGIARVVREHYPDPTTDTPDRWLAVDFAPEQSFKNPVSLTAMKSEPQLEGLLLLRHSRLSVMPVSKAHFDLIVRMGNS